jgi:hypothetical protein
MRQSPARKKELSKRGGKLDTHRRVVTDNVNGKAVVQDDEPLLTYKFKTVPGYKHTLIWVNPAIPDLQIRSKGLTAIPTRSFQDLAAQVFTS